MIQMSVKRGDTLDIGGSVQILEGKVDTTSTHDFSLWSISCQLRDGPTASDTLVATLALAFMGSTPVFSGTVDGILTMGFPHTCFMDLRFKDQNGKVRSSATITLFVVDNISVTP